MPDFSDEAVDPTKAGLRATLLARRRSMSVAARRVAAERVQADLASLIHRVRPERITGYVPVGTEPGGPDLPDLLARALATVAGSAGQLLLPVLRGDLDLDWAPYAGPESLVAAGRGMREPTADRLGRWAIGTAALVVVPALAVDRRGLRLGRGGGSYDRALARAHARALIVALLHDGELIDSVPAESHDQPVRAVITPSGGLLPLPTG